MKILALMKRFGANKDMVLDDFGRQIRLFEPLAKKHRIDFLCPDYKKRENKNIKRNGINFYVRPYSAFRHFSFLKTLRDMIKKNKYDVIVGTSDPLLGILGYAYAKKFRIIHVYDMQDDYSCYSSYRIPFIRYLDEIAVRNSDAVITVSDSLKKKIRKFRKRHTYTLQNGVETNLSKKISKGAARKKLNLPDGKMIVYVGEISRFKGGNILIEAFRMIKKMIPDSHLLLSGKVSDVDINHEGIIYRQFKKREDVALALNAADVAVIPNIRNSFSEYCFPYKLLEYMAVGLPIVATKIGDVGILLKKYKNSLCEPNDANDLKEKLILQLEGSRRIDYPELNEFDWRILAGKLDRILKEMKK